MIIEKSQDEIERIIALVQLSNLPEGTKLFVIGCINLASWIPRALVEHIQSTTMQSNTILLWNS